MNVTQSELMALVREGAQYLDTSLDLCHRATQEIVRKAGPTLPAWKTLGLGLLVHLEHLARAVLSCAEQGLVGPMLGLLRPQYEAAVRAYVIFCRKWRDVKWIEFSSPWCRIRRSHFPKFSYVVGSGSSWQAARGVTPSGSRFGRNSWQAFNVVSFSRLYFMISCTRESRRR